MLNAIAVAVVMSVFFGVIVAIVGAFKGKGDVAQDAKTESAEESKPAVRGDDSGGA
jgi:hypothetical protein